MPVAPAIEQEERFFQEGDGAAEVRLASFRQGQASPVAGLAFGVA